MADPRGYRVPPAGGTPGIRFGDSSGPALAAAGLGSFFAGCVGTLILAAFAPRLTELAFKFGQAEYFSLMILGLIGAVVLDSGSLLKAITMILFGLALASRRRCCSASSSGR